MQTPTEASSLTAQAGKAQGSPIASGEPATAQPYDGALLSKGQEPA